MVRIGLDIMGGDFAPIAPLEGIRDAIQELEPNFTLILFGDETYIKNYLEQENIDSTRIEIVATTEVIDMGESPTKAIVKKPNSSISVGFQHLKAKNIDIFVSAGNTGAMLVGAMYSVKAAEGVIRPAIASMVPSVNGSYGVLLDVGANPDAKPDVLQQFAILGSLYAKHVIGKENPKIGLLNIGTEPEKGSLVAQAAYKMMEGSEKFNFLGNIEGYDMFTGQVDVIVCDGFVGNIVLKTSESLYKILGSKLENDPFITRFDYQNYGGTPILGINKPVLIGHGVSSPLAFKNMVRQSVDIVQSELIEKVKSTFEP